MYLHSSLFACTALSVCAAMVAGCGSGKPTDPSAPVAPRPAPQVLRWYTTPGPLSGTEGKIMMVDPAGKEWLVVEVQFAGSALWVKGGLKGAKEYEAKQSDFQLRTPDGQTTRAAGTARVGVNDWAMGGQFTGDPSDANSRLLVAFSVRQDQVGKGAFVLEYRDLSPAELPDNKKSPGPPK